QAPPAFALEPGPRGAEPTRGPASSSLEFEAIPPTPSRSADEPLAEPLAGSAAGGPATSAGAAFEADIFEFGAESGPAAAPSWPTAVGRDDDILGVALELPLPPPAPSHRGGETLKLERESLGEVVFGESGADTGWRAAHQAGTFPEHGPQAAGVAVGLVEAVEVEAQDRLFQEEGIEPTKLSAGRPQEILIPLEVHTSVGVRRFRLALKLELADE
ncbi:MAG: hypothetical protein JSV80_18480, partial [Acidobacteriota bacterium]